MSLKKTIRSRIKRAHEKGWNKLIIAVDLHDTIISSDRFNEYCNDSETTGSVGDAALISIYPKAKEVLRILSNRKDIQLVFYSATDYAELKEISTAFEQIGVLIDVYFEEPKEKFYQQAFDNKPCFDILLDDKAGFDPKKDWRKVEKHLRKVVLN